MKILNKAKSENELSDIKFDNIEYFSFDVTNKEIAELLKVVCFSIALTLNAITQKIDIKIFFIMILYNKN